MSMNTEQFFNYIFEGMNSDESLVVCYAFKAKDSDRTILVNKSATSFSQASRTALEYSKKANDTFFGIFTYKDNLEDKDGKIKVRRTKTHSRRSRVLILDIDCGEDKPYKEWKDGLAAAVPALVSIGFKKEQLTFVCSGGGVHVYIRFNEFLPKSKWEPIAAAFKAKVLATGLHIDPSKTTDTALVLRPAGTYNFKKDKARPVEVLSQATEDVTVEFVDKILEPQTAVELEEIDTLPDSVIDGGLATKEFAKPNYEKVQSSCAQIAALASDCNVPEPLWYSALGVAAFTDNPKAAAITWSKEYAKYNEAATLAKLAQWSRESTGPASCKRFSDLNPDGCKKCPFNGTIKTPLQAVNAPSPSIVGFKEEAIDLPPNYKIKNGQIVHFNDELELPVSDYIMYVDNLAMDGDVRSPKSYAKLKIQLPRVGWTDLEFEAGLVFGSKGESFCALMGSAGVFAQGKQMSAIRDYIAASLRHYQHTKDIAKITESMGWTSDGTFIYGMNEYRGTGYRPRPVTPKGSAILTVASDMTKKGRFEDWIEAVRFLSQEGMEKLAFGYLLGYASLVFGFNGLGGATINFYSEHSGTGKSTACRFATSIFADPERFVGGKSDTTTALFSTLSSLNHIPYFIDEVSDAGGEQVSDWLYTISSGKEKQRADKTGEVRESRHWNLLLLMSSNKSLYEKLDEYTASASGQRARMIELNMPPLELIEEHGKALNLTLNNNHGHAAPIMINHLVDLYKQGGLEMRVQMAASEFKKEFGFEFNANERFIEATIASTWFIGREAMKLGLCPDFDLNRIFENIIFSIRDYRQLLNTSIESCGAVLNAFLAENAMYLVKHSKYSYKEGEVSVPDNKLVGRVEVHFSGRDTSKPDFGYVYIGFDAFRQFCRNTKRPFYKYAEQFREMREFSLSEVQITKGGKLYNKSQTPVVPTTLRCFGMVLPLDTIDIIERKVDKDEKFPI